MGAPKRPTKRKLLAAKVGMATLTVLACSAFPACNLLPPPPCDSGTGDECGRAPRDARPDGESDAETPSDASGADV